MDESRRRQIEQRMAVDPAFRARMLAAKQRAEAKSPPINVGDFSVLPPDSTVAAPDTSRFQPFQPDTTVVPDSAQFPQAGVPAPKPQKQGPSPFMRDVRGLSGSGFLSGFNRYSPLTLGIMAEPMEGDSARGIPPLDFFGGLGYGTAMLTSLMAPVKAIGALPGVSNIGRASEALMQQAAENPTIANFIRSLGGQTVSGGVKGTIYGGAHNAAQQLTQTGQIDPLQALQAAGESGKMFSMFEAAGAPAHGLKAGKALLAQTVQAPAVIKATGGDLTEGDQAALVAFPAVMAAISRVPAARSAIANRVRAGRTRQQAVEDILSDDTPEVVAAVETAITENPVEFAKVAGLPEGSSAQEISAKIREVLQSKAEEVRKEAEQSREVARAKERLAGSAQAVEMPKDGVYRDMTGSERVYNFSDAGNGKTRIIARDTKTGDLVVDHVLPTESVPKYMAARATRKGLEFVSPLAEKATSEDAVSALVSEFNATDKKHDYSKFADGMIKFLTGESNTRPAPVDAKGKRLPQGQAAALERKLKAVLAESMQKPVEENLVGLTDPTMQRPTVAEESPTSVTTVTEAPKPPSYESMSIYDLDNAISDIRKELKPLKSTSQRAVELRKQLGELSVEYRARVQKNMAERDATDKARKAASEAQALRILTDEEVSSMSESDISTRLSELAQRKRNLDYSVTGDKTGVRNAETGETEINAINETIAKLRTEEGRRRKPEEPTGQKASQGERPPAAELDAKILNALTGENGRHIDDIASETGLSTGDALANLLMLELKGKVEQLPGKRFRRRPGGEEPSGESVAPTDPPKGPEAPEGGKPETPEQKAAREAAEDAADDVASVYTRAHLDEIRNNGTDEVRELGNGIIAFRNKESGKQDWTVVQEGKGIAEKIELPNGQKFVNGNEMKPEELSKAEPANGGTEAAPAGGVVQKPQEVAPGKGTDKSVRDNSSTVVVRGDKVVVVQKSGREKQYDYSFPVSDYPRKSSALGNPNYLLHDQVEFLKKHSPITGEDGVLTPLDERIYEAQASAINKALGIDITKAQPDHAKAAASAGLKPVGESAPRGVEAVRKMLGSLLGLSDNLYVLSGKGMARHRQRIMSALRGENVSAKDSGLHNLISEVEKAVGREVTSAEGRDALRKFIETGEIVAKPETNAKYIDVEPTDPAFTSLLDRIKYSFKAVKALYDWNRPKEPLASSLSRIREEILADIENDKRILATENGGLSGYKPGPFKKRLAQHEKELEILDAIREDRFSSQGDWTYQAKDKGIWEVDDIPLWNRYLKDFKESAQKQPEAKPAEKPAEPKAPKPAPAKTEPPKLDATAQEQTSTPHDVLFSLPGKRVALSGEYNGKTGVVLSLVQKRYAKDRDMVRIQIDGVNGSSGGWDGKVTVDSKTLSWPTSPQAKEPWMRPMSDYESGGIIPAELYDGLKTPDGGVLKVVKNEDGTLTVTKILNGAELPLATNADEVIARDQVDRAFGARPTHADLFPNYKKSVEAAVKDGNPVPAEVLAQFPDLKPAEQKPSGKGDIDTALQKIRDYKAGNYSSEKTKLYQELGFLAVPGIRLGSAEEAGRLYESFKNGDVPQEGWDSFVEDLYSSRKATKPTGKAEPTTVADQDGEGRVVARMMPVKDIARHPDLQPRNNEENLAWFRKKGWKPSAADPIGTVMVVPPDNNFSGKKVQFTGDNTRLQYAEEIGMKEIPATVFDIKDIARDEGLEHLLGTPEGEWKIAVEWARGRNERAMAQTTAETAKSVKAWREMGLSEEKIIEKIGTRKYNEVADVANLNPEGKFAAVIDTPGVPGKLRDYARWIGNIRGRFQREFTNKHEDEVFDFLMKDRESLPDIKKENFVSMIEGRISDMLWDPKSPLNLKKDEIITGSRAHAENIEELRAKRSDLVKRISEAKTHEEKEALGKDLKDLDDRIEKAFSNQTDLFGGLGAFMGIPDPRVVAAHVRKVVSQWNETRKKQRELDVLAKQANVKRVNAKDIGFFGGNVNTIGHVFDIFEMTKNMKKRFPKGPRHGEDAKIAAAAMLLGDRNIRKLAGGWQEQILHGFRDIKTALGKDALKNVPEWLESGIDKVPSEARSGVEKIRVALDDARGQIRDAMRDRIENDLAKELGARYKAQKKIPQEDALPDDVAEKFMDKARKIAEERVPDDWGLEDYFPHMFIGDFRIFYDGELIGAATTKSDALTKAHSHFIKSGESNNLDSYKIDIVNFKTPETLRMSDNAYTRFLMQLTESANVSVSEMKSALSGVATPKSKRNKYFGNLMKREGAKGYDLDPNEVLELYTSGAARYIELSKLSRVVQPVIDGLKAGGKPNASLMMERAFSNMWGTGPTPVSRQIDVTVQKTLDATINKALPERSKIELAPQLADRSLSRIRAVKNFLLITANPGFQISNSLQKIQTLWPIKSGEVSSIEVSRWMDSKEGQDAIERHGVRFIIGGGKFTEKSLFGLHLTPEQRQSAYARLKQLMPETKNQYDAWSTMYLTAKKRGYSDKEAADYAFIEGNIGSQFLSVPSNVPHFEHNPLLKTMLQYRRFMVQNLELVSRLVRDGNMSGTSKWFSAILMLGGTRAFTKLATSLPVIGAVSTYLTTQMYDKLKEEYGDEVANMFQYGLPAIIGLDMSNTMSPLDIPTGTRAFGFEVTLAANTVAAINNTQGYEHRPWKRVLNEFSDATPGTRTVKNLITILEGPEDGRYNIKDEAGRVRYSRDLYHAILGLTNRSLVNESLALMDVQRHLYLVQKQDEVADKIVMRWFEQNKKAGKTSALSGEALKMWEQWRDDHPAIPITSDQLTDRYKRLYGEEATTSAERVLEKGPKAIKQFSEQNKHTEK